MKNKKMIHKVLSGARGYKKLSHLPFNRDYSLRNTLVESMKSNGFIVPINCIYTDVITGIRELYILDGQNRALAAQYLDIPFDIMILEEEPTTKERLVELVAILNNTSVPWKLETYCKAYASLAYEDYTKLLKYSKLHGQSVSTTASLLGGSLSGRNPEAGRKLRGGDFKIVAEASTLETFSLISRMGVKFTGRMTLAFHKLRMLHDDFNFEVFRTNLLRVYDEVKASRLDEYYDLFVTFLKK
jgi:hypothetical protein